MSSFLSGSGRAFRLDLDILKTPTTSWTSTNSSTPSSTLSESRNSHLSISTRKARTPRKRPNQIYNEAAAILSTAYPKLFSTKHLSKPHKFPGHGTPFPFEPLDLLIPFQAIDSPLETSKFSTKQKGLNSLEKTCQSPGEISSHVKNFSDICDDDCQEDFDAESILDEEIGEGIDSIMGQLSMESKSVHDSNCSYGYRHDYPVGLGFNFGYGIRRELRGIKNGDEDDDCWRFPTVNVVDITKKMTRMPAQKSNSESKTSKGNSLRKLGLLLKLDYDDVLSKWGDKGSPYCLGSPVADNDVQVRLAAQVDLFQEKGEEGGGTLVNKEKRHLRPHFSKRISCQVRKVKPDQRPRLKGRCVRKQNCLKDEEG